jgi:hypothetical protein
VEFSPSEIVQQSPPYQMLLITLSKSQGCGELCGKAGYQKTMLVRQVVVLPNSFELLPDTTISDRGHNGCRRLIDARSF